MIVNKIADKITSVSKKKSNNNNNDDDVELATHKERYISPGERQQIIDELRLELKIIKLNIVFNNIIKNGIPKNSKLVRKHIR